MLKNIKVVNHTCSLNFYFQISFNAIVFTAALVFFPSMHVKDRLSYGAQVSVLKKPINWISIVAVILLNSAVYGVYSYLVEYLKTVTNTSGKSIRLILVIFGGANIFRNIVAWKFLTKDAIKSVVSFPFALGTVYILLFLLGQFTLPMAIIILVWGMLAGIGGIINQYWITSAAPEAPDFANGLYLSSVNLGTTIGTAVGGLFISEFGTQKEPPNQQWTLPEIIKNYIPATTRFQMPQSR